MMLLLRPNCEWCDCDLPPDSPDARICTYECTTVQFALTLFCTTFARRVEVVLSRDLFAPRKLIVTR